MARDQRRGERAVRGAFTLHNEGGAGEPIVFLHGFLGRPSMWSEVREGLLSEPPIALATLPGHGPTPWFPEEDSFLGAIHALASRWPSSSAFVVGYSMGARVALGLALLYPERVRGALLIGVDPGLRSEEERAQRLSWDEAQAAQLEREGLDAFSARWAALPLFATQAKLPATRRAAQQLERREHTGPGAAWAMRTLGLGRMPSWWDLLSSNRVPLRVVSGALDQKFTRIGATLPAATHTVVAEVGHNVALEAPEVIARLIDGWSAQATEQVEPPGST